MWADQDIIFIYGLSISHLSRRGRDYSIIYFNILEWEQPRNLRLPLNTCLCVIDTCSSYIKNDHTGKY